MDYLRQRSRRRAVYRALLLVYCVAFPVACLVSSVQLDSLSTDLNVALPQLGQQAILCTPRLIDAHIEFVVIYLPFLITGVLVFMLSLYILVSLRRHNATSDGGSPRPSRQHNNKALTTLVTHLTVLAVCTSVLLIVFAYASLSVILSISSFFDLWYNAFTCAATAYAW